MFQEWPPTLAAICNEPSGPTAPYLFIHSMISCALSDDQMSYAVVKATPLVGTDTLKELVVVPSVLTRLPIQRVAFGYALMPPVLGWLAQTPQLLGELAQI